MLIRRLDKQCDLRLDAFREGLEHGETAHRDPGRVTGPGRGGGVPDGAGAQPEPAVQTGADGGRQGRARPGGSGRPRRSCWPQGRQGRAGAAGRARMPHRLHAHRPADQPLRRPHDDPDLREERVSDYEAPSKYKGTGTYGVLTEAEQCTWDEYTNLRAISD